MKEITYNNLQEAILALLIKTDEIKSLLINASSNQKNASRKELYTSTEVCSLLKISKSSLVKLRSKGLPTIKIDTSIRFDIEEVISFLKSNRQKERAP